MKVVITGGAGFLGKKLARRILQQGTIAGASGAPERVSELLLFDVAKATGPGLDDPRVKALAGDIANFATLNSIMQFASGPTMPAHKANANLQILSFRFRS